MATTSAASAVGLGHRLLRPTPPAPGSHPPHAPRLRHTSAGTAAACAAAAVPAVHPYLTEPQSPRYRGLPGLTRHDLSRNRNRDAGGRASYQPGSPIKEAEETKAAAMAEATKSAVERENAWLQASARQEREKSLLTEEELYGPPGQWYACLEDWPALVRLQRSIAASGDQSADELQPAELARRIARVAQQQQWCAAMSRAQIWDAKLPMISDTSGAAALLI
eukprot:SAG31_NODE_683_length_12836_cov_8.304938_4_plen_222_part_00